MGETSPRFESKSKHTIIGAKASQGLATAKIRLKVFALAYHHQANTANTGTKMPSMASRTFLNWLLFETSDFEFPFKRHSKPFCVMVIIIVSTVDMIIAPMPMPATATNMAFVVPAPFTLPDSQDSRAACAPSLVWL